MFIISIYFLLLFWNEQAKLANRSNIWTNLWKLLILSTALRRVYCAIKDTHTRNIYASYLEINPDIFSWNFLSLSNFVGFIFRKIFIWTSGVGSKLKRGGGRLIRAPPPPVPTPMWTLKRRQLNKLEQCIISKIIITMTYIEY